MNFIQVNGNLGADPEVRFTATGLKVTNLRIATTVRRKDKEETIWYRLTIWGDRYDKMMPYLKKGSAIVAIGELKKPEIYMDKEGKPQISLEIDVEILRFQRSSQQQDKPQEGAGAAGSSAGAGQQNQGSYASENHAKPAYGNSGQVTSGQSMQQNSYAEEEETLPF